MKAIQAPADIDQYIEAASPEARPVLRKIRKLVAVAVPAATETISYRMPAFKTRRVFFFFAAFKKHIGVYPPVVNDRALMVELVPFANDKGNLSFPLSSPVPYRLIGRVAKALAAQYE